MVNVLFVAVVHRDLDASNIQADWRRIAICAAAICDIDIETIDADVHACSF